MTNLGGLLELIRNHKEELNIAGRVQSSKKYRGFFKVKSSEKYPGFSQELIQLPNYSYLEDQMKETMKFLLDNDFSLDIRYEILERITRRKAMDRIDDFQRRNGIWAAVDKALDTGRGEIEHLREAIDYAGESQTLLDLSGMYDVYMEKIELEFDALKKEYCRLGEENGWKSSPELRLISETLENHGQLSHLVMKHTKSLMDALQKK